MNMVIPRTEEGSLILKDCFVKSLNISIMNGGQDIYTSMGKMVQVATGSTIEVDLSIIANKMESVNEPYEIAVVKEKRVRDCSLGELILAIAGKS